MNFDLPEDHDMLRRMARDFAAAELAPRAAERDELAALEGALVEQLAGLGLWGLGVDEAHGGAGMDALAFTVAVEALAGGDCGVALAVAAHAAVAEWIAAAGDAAQQQRWLSKLASGATRGAWASALDVKAEPDGDAVRLDGAFHLRGGGELTVVQPKLLGPAFLVALDAPGVTVEAQPSLGARAAEPRRVRLDGVRTGPDERLDDGDGRGRARMRLGVAAAAVGVGTAALDRALGYATERNQFGKPISQFQAIQWMLADAATELDAARLLTRKAATEGAGADDARALATRFALAACDRAIQIHGGSGYTREYPVERFWRDARTLSSIE